MARALLNSETFIEPQFKKRIPPQRWMGTPSLPQIRPPRSRFAFRLPVFGATVRFGMIVLLLAVVGCSTTHFVPPDIEPRYSRSLPELVVKDLFDARPQIATPRASWWWVPGLATTAHVDGKPERDPRLELDPTEDVTAALATIAAGTKRFSRVERTQETSVNLDGYVLSGELVELTVERKRLTGRFGFLAAPVWLLGAPTQTVEVRLSVALHMDVAPELGKSWSRTLTSHRKRLCSWYVNTDWRDLVVEDMGRILVEEWRRAWKAAHKKPPPGDQE